MADLRDSRENVKAPRKGSGKRKLFLILGGAVLLAGALTAFFIWLAAYLHVYEIDLSQYVTVAYEGYDGAGEARIVVDREAFLQEYTGKLRWKDRADKEKGDPAEALLGALDIRLTEKSGLESGSFSNGDDLRIRWKNKSFAKRIANAKISMETFHVKTEGLTKPGSFDAFAALEVVYDGLDGEGWVVKVVEHSGLKYQYGLEYKVIRANSSTTTVPLYGPSGDGASEPGGEGDVPMNRWEGHLKNGDTVTVSIGGAGVQRELIRTYGMKPLEMEKVFTVEGLTTYTLFDPFEDLELIFTGKNGSGILQNVKNHSTLPAAQKLGFQFSPNQGLKNGDTVKVTVIFGPVKRETMAKTYGMLPESLEKTFIVSGLENESSPEPPGGGGEGEGGEMDNAFGTLEGRLYKNTFFRLKASFPDSFTLYGKGSIPSDVLGGLNDLFASAGSEENVGVRIQTLTEEEKSQTAKAILENYTKEIFEIYRSYGANLTSQFKDVVFAGAEYTCLDITAEWRVIIVVKRIRHRIYIRKEGDYAIAVSVMAGDDKTLERYCGYFEKLE